MGPGSWPKYSELEDYFKTFLIIKFKALYQPKEF